MVALAFVLVFTLPVQDWLLDVVRWVRAAGVWGVLAFAAAYVLAAVVLWPGSLLTLGAGFAYGPFVGLAIVSPVSVLASTVAFCLARGWLHSWVARRTANMPRFRAIDRAVAENGFRVTLLLRLSPVLPYNLLNYALGLTNVKLGSYVLASFIGMLPATFMYVYLGSLITNLDDLVGGGAGSSPARRVLYVGGLLATVVVTVWVTRLSRQALKQELSRREASELNDGSEPAEASNSGDVA